jgi:hypothetical protein
MSSRGAEELIIADIALRAGLFSQSDGVSIITNMFSAVIIMALVTTVLTPILLKFLSE